MNLMILMAVSAASGFFLALYVKAGLLLIRHYQGSRGIILDFKSKVKVIFLWPWYEPRGAWKSWK